MLSETFSLIFKYRVHRKTFKSLGSCIDVKWNCCQITFRPSITQQGSYLSCLIKGAKKVYLCLGSFSPTPSTLEVTQTITRKIGNFCFPSFETPMKGNSGTNLECRDDKQTQTDSQVSTLFENYSKCRIWIFEFWDFPPIFVLLKLTCLVTLFDRKLQVFKKSPKWTIFGIFN